MRRSCQRLHSERMSTIQANALNSFSQAVTELVEKTKGGVLALKSAAHRVTSGVVLGDNLIAAASHSLRREDRVPVYAADGSQATATVLGRDPGIDLAILKAEGLNTQTIPNADPASLKTGSVAVVVGHTIDVGATASLGIVGAVGPARKNWRGGTLDQFLRLDANVYPSQSGAAVVNTEGLLIGMATPALSRHSTVVLPTSTIERMARELLEQGRIRHGYLGVGVQPVAIVRNREEQNQKTGLILLSVEPGSPADNAGLLLGDVLLTLDAKPMTDIDDLHTALRGDMVGKTVKAAVLRGGVSVEVEVNIIERGGKS